MISKKYQARHWSDQSKQHIFISASEMAAVFKESQYGTYLEANLSSSCGNKDSPQVLPRLLLLGSLHPHCFSGQDYILLMNKMGIFIWHEYFSTSSVL